YPFIVRPDSDNYDSLLPKQGLRVGPVFRRLFDPAPLASEWRPIPVERFPNSRKRNRGKPVDFPSMGGSGLACSQKALEALASLIADDIEALPLDCPEPYYLIHPLVHLDCLDEQRSVIRRYPDGNIAEIEKWAFKSKGIQGKHIFRVPQSPDEVLV